MHSNATKRAKLFVNGRSQAVRLPAEFRFPGDDVYIRRDAETGDVILSARPGGNWRMFMQRRRELCAAPEDFLVDRQQSAQPRDPFGDWSE